MSRPRKRSEIIAIDGEGMDGPAPDLDYSYQDAHWNAELELQALRQSIGPATDRIKASRTTLVGGTNSEQELKESRQALRAMRERATALRKEIATLRNKPVPISAPEHHYTLLAASTGAYVESDDLSTVQCLDFLLSLNPNALVIGYSINYDVNMWLRDVPWKTLQRLYEQGRAQWGMYKLRWKQGKEFSVRVGKEHTTVWDVFGYFQCSFVKALQQWGITGKRVDRIATMKEQRGSFHVEQTKQIRDYCLDECELLVEVFTRLRECWERVGLQPRRYDGAGSLAAALMTREQVAAHIAPPPSDLRTPVLSAYFGGRFESAAIGDCGSGYSYDITSAYPAVARDLPCLLCGEWTASTQVVPWGLYHVRWRMRGSWPTWGPLPFRLAGGRILYPVAGRGWYWGSEVAAAQAFADGCVQVDQGYVYQTQCGHKPFGFVPAVFETRARLKEASDFGAQVLKLALNSLYGKTAQSIGHGDTPPKFQSFVWAGMITAGCRAQILAALTHDREAVVSIATDGLLSTRKLHNLDVGSALGQWKMAPVDNIFLAQNGVYEYTEEAGEFFRRNRGFSARELEFDVIRRAVAVDGADAHWNTRVRRFIGLGTALHRKDRSVWRRWLDIDKTVCLRPQNRVLLSEMAPAPTTTEGPIRTLAWLAMEGESYPYTPKMTWDERVGGDGVMGREQP